MVEILKVEQKNPDMDILKKAADAIRLGKLVIYPTDTVYGLAADATSDDAAKKVFDAKSRSRDKPISIAVNSLSMAYYAGKITEDAERLVQEFLPGPLTILVGKRPSISDLLSAGTEKIGIRIPDHPTVLNLIEIVGKPITTTSANISGNKSPVEVGEAIDQIGDHVEFAIDTGKAKLGKASTVVDVTESKPVIIREGPIPASELKPVID